MEIFDSHSHYDDKAFDEDRDYLLGEYLPSHGVIGIIHAATDKKSSLWGIENAKKYGYCYTAVGIHPENIDFTDPAAAVAEIEPLCCEKKVVAVGEIGLDYHYEGYDRDLQIALFEEQLKLAEKYSLPVIVHCRNATEDCLELLRKYRPRGVMHCFSGSAETAKEIVSLGMYVGFTGVITFKNAKKAIKAMEAVPTERLLLETDCPYMAPEPLRGRRSDSAMILLTAEKMAEVKGVSVEKMLSITAENCRRLFSVNS